MGSPKKRRLRNNLRQARVEEKRNNRMGTTVVAEEVIEEVAIAEEVIEPEPAPVKKARRRRTNLNKVSTETE